MQRPYHFVGSSTAAFQALQSYDLDPNQVFEEAGLNVKSLSDPEYRLSTADWIGFWRRCIEKTGDPLFLIRCTDYIQPTCFHAFGMALFASRTLRSFCQRYTHHNSFFTTSYSIRFDEAQEHPTLIYRLGEPLGASSEDAKLLLSGTCAWIIQMMRLMYNRKFSPVLITFMHSPDEFQEDYEKFFGCPIEYDAGYYSLSFNNDDLNTPLPTGNAEIAHQNDEVVLKFLSRIERANMPNRVRAALFELFPTGEFSKETIAKNLAVSVRTLHNRLAEEGVTYQEILDETRQKLAEQYLRQSQHTVGDVAFLLGFSDFSNFSRAFKRWTGQTPSDYRKEMLGQ